MNRPPTLRWERHGEFKAGWCRSPVSSQRRERNTCPLLVYGEPRANLTSWRSDLSMEGEPKITEIEKYHTQTPNIQNL